LPGPQAASAAATARIARIGARLMASPFGLELYGRPRQETEVNLIVLRYP
jgi:hypothetical protein